MSTHSTNELVPFAVEDFSVYIERNFLLSQPGTNAVREDAVS